MISGLGPLAALGSSVTWAIASIGYKQLSDKYHPIQVAFLRTCLGFPALLLLTFALNPSSVYAIFDMPTGSLGLLSLSMVFSYVMGDTLLLLSMRMIKVPEALALASIYPLWSIIGGSVWEQQPLSWQSLVGIAMVVLGLVGVVYQKPQRRGGPLPTPSRRLTGALMAIGASLFWSLNALSVRYGAEDQDPIGATLVRLGSGIGITFVAHFLWRVPVMSLFAMMKQNRQIVPIILMETVLGTFFFLYGLSHSGLITGIILTSLSPLFSAPLSFWLLGQRLSLQTFIAIVMTLAATLWLITQQQLT